MNREHPIVWNDETVARLWDYYARTPPYAGNYFSNVHGREILRKCRLPLYEPKTILDIGCGPGFIWEHINRLKATWSYAGVDFSKQSISQLVQKAAGHPQFTGAFHITGLQIPFPDSTFDVAFLVEVVEHLNDDQLPSTISEAKRLLKSGGALVVTTPNEEDLSSSAKYCPECGAIFHEWQHVRSWSRTTLRSYMEGYGFREKFYVSLDFSESGKPLVWIARRLKRLITGTRKLPHMIAVFEKLSS
jgi:SAM-dependent methyltransferase